MMTPTSLSFVKNVAFPFLRTWSSFEPCKNNHPDLRHLASTEYKEDAAETQPSNTKHVLKTYNILLRDLRIILKTETEPLYLGQYRRGWYATATQVVDELVQMSHDVMDKAKAVHSVNSHQAFQTSVRVFADKVQESHDKFWQAEISMRVALDINAGEEEDFLTATGTSSE